jgi:hypothetical protein
MKSLFDSADRAALLARIEHLQPASTRLWGKMNPSQMLTHCYRVLETGAGVTPSKQAFLGKIITPFIRGMVLGEKPFSRNSPTGPSFVVSDERDFEAERKRLLEVADIFVTRGPGAAGQQLRPLLRKTQRRRMGSLFAQAPRPSPAAVRRATTSQVAIGSLA